MVEFGEGKESDKKNGEKSDSMNISDEAIEEEDLSIGMKRAPLKESCDKEDTYRQESSNQDDISLNLEVVPEEENISKHTTNHLQEMKEDVKFHETDGENSKRMPNIDVADMGFNKIEAEEIFL